MVRRGALRRFLIMTVEKGNLPENVRNGADGRDGRKTDVSTQ
jgi:hypothetical protein